LLISELAAAQNPDGGWGYRGGPSWTEPTAYAILATAGQPDGDAPVRRARSWILRNHRPDGGFAPRPSVQESTWVTALALLSGAVRDSGEPGAVDWLLGQSGRESGFVFRLRQWMLGNQKLSASDASGWSWYPGTAAWVVPTSLTMLALGKVERRYPGKRIRERIDQGRQYLLSHMCEDGGWNHGSSRALGFQSTSYPETTGIALLALRGVGSARLEKSIARAEEHFRGCRSVEGLSWLVLGLLAQGRRAPEIPPDIPSRTVMDCAIGALAGQARQRQDPFLKASA
jgi:squalene cyclase